MDSKYKKEKVAHQIFTERELWRRFMSKLALEGTKATRKIKNWIEEYVDGVKS